MPLSRSTTRPLICMLALAMLVLALVLAPVLALASSPTPAQARGSACPSSARAHERISVCATPAHRSRARTPAARRRRPSVRRHAARKPKVIATTPAVTPPPPSPAGSEAAAGPTPEAGCEGQDECAFDSEGPLGEEAACQSCEPTSAEEPEA